MELKDTIDLMNSKDYKERFKAEYLQLKIRIEKLETMLIKLEAGTLGYEPTCDIPILEDQLYYMKEYSRMLRVRAEKEGINVTQSIDRFSAVYDASRFLEYTKSPLSTNKEKDV